MRFVKGLIMTVVFLFAAGSAHASAVLVDASGSVKIDIPGAKAVAPQYGLQLPDGSVVKVPENGKASVLLESGAVDEISPGSSYTVGAKAGKSRRTDFGNGMAVAMRELSASGEGPSVHGMVKEAKGPVSKLPSIELPGAGSSVALYPIGTSIRLDDSLRFRWTNPIPGGWRSPMIIVRDGRGTKISSKPLTAGSVDISVSAPELKLTKGGKFCWYLAADDGGIKGKSACFEFSTLSLNEEKALDTDIAKVKALGISDEGKAFLISQLYYQRGMYDDMTRLIEPVWQRTRSDYLKKMLRTGYQRMGRTEEADKHK